MKTLSRGRRGAKREFAPRSRFLTLRSLLDDNVFTPKASNSTARGRDEVAHPGNAIA